MLGAAKALLVELVDSLGPDGRAANQPPPVETLLQPKGAPPSFARRSAWYQSDHPPAQWLGSQRRSTRAAYPFAPSPSARLPLPPHLHESVGQAVCTTRRIPLVLP